MHNMICCSVEQLDNGISHVCNWRSIISEEHQWLFVSVWQSTPLPPSGQWGGCTSWSGVYLRMRVVFARVSVGVPLPRTCPSSPQAFCNLPDMREAPSDSLLLGPLDSPGWSWIFISSSECVRGHARLHKCVWWVCNLSDTSQPRGRGMTDSNSAFTGHREQLRVTGRYLMRHVLLPLPSASVWPLRLLNTPLRPRM